MKPDSAQIQKEITERRSGYWTIFKAFVPVNVYLQAEDTYLWYFWDVTGMMLLGMGLIKLGVFSATRSMRFYAAMAIIGYTIGVPLNAYVAYDDLLHNFEPVRSWLLAWTYDLGRLTVALAHVGVVMMIYRTGLMRWLTSRLAAVGQMALTNYVMHTVICTLLFHGYGFGLFGKLERFHLLGVVVAIWIFQLIVSPIWLRHFRFGPLEWAWRSLTYWQRQPMRIHTTMAEPTALTYATV
jgi:uncharacterized protein